MYEHTSFYDQYPNFLPRIYPSTFPLVYSFRRSCLPLAKNLPGYKLRKERLLPRTHEDVNGLKVISFDSKRLKRRSLVSPHVIPSASLLSALPEVFLELRRLFHILPINFLFYLSLLRVFILFFGHCYCCCCNQRAINDREIY